MVEPPWAALGAPWGRMLMRCAGKVFRLQRHYRRLGVGAGAVAMLGHTLRERNTADGPTPPPTRAAQRRRRCRQAARG
ncbi:MAG TPA: hypothetical protein VNB06_11385, partial [Thermoanaerobaculia bacterium]|nr:hypothetical protein [Thermoanaerobaculia bacterium]